MTIHLSSFFSFLRSFSLVRKIRNNNLAWISCNSSGEHKREKATQFPQKLSTDENQIILWKCIKIAKVKKNELDRKNMENLRKKI